MRRIKHFRTLALFSIILISLVFPLVIVDSTIMSLAVDTLLLMVAAASWNIFSGYTGYISLGQATYYGLGAYTLAVVCKDWNVTEGFGPFLLVPVAGLVAGVFALSLGWIVLRTRRYTFMVITIALFFIFQLFAYNLTGITGGSEGIFLPIPSWSSDFMNVPFYYVALALLLAVTVVSWWIRNSTFGLVLLAIRDDEDRACGLGVSTGWLKLGAYVLSATFTGMVGATSIYFAGLITPSFAFDATLNANVLVVTYLGGVGSVMGPIVGGLVFDPVQTYLTQQFGPAGSGINLMLFGGFLLLVILFLPEGIVPSFHRRWSHRTSASRNTPQTLSAPAPVIHTTFPVSPAQPLALALPVLSVQSHPGGPQPASPFQAIPHRPVATQPQEMSQKIRAQRLVPISRQKSLQPQQLGAAPVVSWRCPLCRKPLLIKGDSCYCPRCGMKRPLPNKTQPGLSSFLLREKISPFAGKQG